MKMKLTTAQAQQIVANDRKKNITAYLLNECFQEQKEFIQNPSRLKAILASRRSGKSFVSGIYLLIEALNNPGVSCLYLGLERKSVKRIMLKDVFEVLLNKFKIQYRFNGTDLIYTFENGSNIYLMGLDNAERDSAKIKGAKYKLAILDECADWTQDQRKIVYSDLKPAMIDLDGTIVLIGTPGDIISTENPPLFYAVTNEIERQERWKLFRWNALNNPHMAIHWKREISEHAKFDPEWLSSANYHQEYLGEWVLNIDRTVYKFNPDKNLIRDLPTATEYIYVLGMDLGWNDSTAFTLAAYSRFDPNLYIIKTFDSPKMLIDDIGKKISEWNKEHPITKYVIDGANKQFVEQMRANLQLPFVSAQKTEKAKFIRMFNSDLQMSRIKLLPGNEGLIDEWNSLVWDPKMAKPTELARCKNHLCFIAGTKIATNKGEVNIEDIKEGDLVLTRDGFKPVLIATDTGTRQTYKLITEQGRELTGTGNHPIFANGEWAELNKLKTGDILTCIKNHQELTCQIKTDQVSNSHTTELNLGDIQNQIKENCEYISPVKMEKDYTESYMKKITDLLQLDITFIIKMKILLIMILKIWKQYQQKIIKDYIVWKEWKIQNIKQNLLNNYYRLMIWLKNGTDQKKVESGIYSTEKILGLPDNLSHYAVNFANNNFNPRFQQPQYVAINVMPQKEENQELMMNQETVSNAIQNSKLIDIQNRNFVQDRVLEVSILKEQKVYNLSVKDKHEYFANGILVSNCDSTLYAFRFARHYLAETIKEAVDRSTEEYMFKATLAKYKKIADAKKGNVLKSDIENDWDKEFNY
jgi:intein/homing endonuclease